MAHEAMLCHIYAKLCYAKLCCTVCYAIFYAVLHCMLCYANLGLCCAVLHAVLAILYGVVVLCRMLCDAVPCCSGCVLLCSARCTHANTMQFGKEVHIGV